MSFLLIFFLECIVKIIKMCIANKYSLLKRHWGWYFFNIHAYEKLVFTCCSNSQYCICIKMLYCLKGHFIVNEWKRIKKKYVKKIKHIWFLELFPTLTFNYKQDFCDNYLYQAKAISNYLICITIKSYKGFTFSRLKCSLLICTKWLGKLWTTFQKPEKKYCLLSLNSSSCKD